MFLYAYSAMSTNSFYLQFGSNERRQEFYPAQTSSAVQFNIRLTTLASHDGYQICVTLW